MNNKKNWLILIWALLLAVAIHFASFNKLIVEKYYSRGIYPYISTILKYGFGWLPFSIGDVLYGAAFLWILYKITLVITQIVKKRMTMNQFFESIRNSFLILIVLYIVFNVLWGINYNRTGIASQLGLEQKEYSTSDLITIDSLLLLRVNKSKIATWRNGNPVISTEIIKQQTVIAFEKAANKYPFLSYHPASIKTSLWGWLGNYLGFIGYFNPFTGEAQVNTTVPKFLHPFTFCHETAHQLGYAKENEANFVGYLAAKASTDTAFHYAAYLDLFLYAQRNLYLTDSNTAKQFAKKLLPAVKKDLKDWRTFNLMHRSPIEPVIAWMYGNYLKNNEQPSGVLSYNEVIGLLIAYYKKTGSI